MAPGYAFDFKFVNRGLTFNERYRKPGSLSWILWQAHKTSHHTRSLCVVVFTESEELCGNIHLNTHTGSVKCNKVCVVTVPSVAF
jgi:hypothetical protein